MKKFFLTILVCFVALSGFSVEFTDFVLREGFENGMPTGWTQENIAGQQNWTIEDGTTAEYPVGAFEGQYRLALRNSSTSSLGFTTRFISPKLELSKVFEPILIFAHAQQQRTGDFEHLKVYYRTSATGTWILLKEYTSKIAKWQEDTLQLVATTDDYYIAFETTDAMGHGVVLDDIRVRTKPTCAVPSQFEATTLDPHTSQLTWKGSYDTEYFEIIVSTDSMASITPDTTTVIRHETTSDFTITLGNLPTQSTYWVYIKAFCEEETDWATFKFNTPNVVDLPYTQTFDMPADQKFIYQPEGWVCGTSLLNSDGDPAFLPYINTDEMSMVLNHYSHSITTCLDFVGNADAYIPAGQYVYAATPEINVKKIQDVEVTFWGASYYYQKLGAANGITVGVMTDPNDFTSFVPIKTVYNRGFDNPFYYHVSFENYEGNGKFIAFVSDFKEQANLFCLDDITITEKAPLNTPTQVKAGNWTKESFDITVNTHGAESWNLILAKGTYSTSNLPIEDGSEADAANVVLRKDGLTGNKVTINISDFAESFNPKTNAFYIYAQAVNGGKTSLWSLPAKYRVPNHIDAIPYTYSFETADDPRYNKQNVTMFNVSTTNATQSVPSSVIIPWESMNYGPSAVTGTVDAKTTADGAACIQMYSNTVFALSEMPTNVDAKALGVEIYVKANAATMNTRAVDVGVMTDPFDASTFEKVSSIVMVSNTEFSRQYVSLASYTGNGHWLAFRPQPAATATSGTGLYSTLVGRIDRITIDSVTDCVPASGLALVEAYEDAADLKWEAAGMHIFDITVASATTKEGSNTILDPATIVYTKHVEDTTGVKVTGLKAATKYFYVVESVCGDGRVQSAIGTFVTACPAKTPLPYTEDFESYTGGVSSGDLPLCWTINPYKNGTSQYPYIYTTASYAHGGSKSLYFSASSKGKLCVTLPLFTESPKNMELTFWLRLGSTSYGTKDSVEVGVMTDPTNDSTFVKVACFQPKTTTYMECIVDFDSYTGEGQYLAIRKAYCLNSYYIIDDVTVEELGKCRKVRDINIGNIKHNGATASWVSSGAPQYQVLVMKQNMDPDLALTAEDVVVYNETVNTTSATVVSEFIGAYETYYLAVRSVCGEDGYGKWSSVKSFQTACQPVTAETFGTDGVETFSTASVLNCWTTGIVSGSSSKPSVTSGYLYLYNNTSSEGSYAIMPMIDVDDIRKVQISFDAHSGNVAGDSHVLKVGVITNAQDMGTGVEMKTIVPPSVDVITDFSGALRYTVRFMDYIGDFTGEKGKQPYFITAGDGKNDRIYMDNLRIENLGEVLEPVDMQFDSIARDMFRMTWEGGLGTKFEVKIATSAIDPDTEAGLKTIEVSDTVCTVSDLNALTTYYVYIRTINGDKKSKWSNVRWFTTECPVASPLPIKENFDNYYIRTAAPYTQPDCWKLYYGDEELTAQATISASAKLSGNGGLLLTSQQSTNKDSYAVLPAVSDDLTKACVKLSCKTTSGSISSRKLRLGVATIVDSIAGIKATTVWVDSIELTDDQWHHQYLSLASYKGEGKNVVLGFIGGDEKNATASAQIFVDDLSLMESTACHSPFYPRVTKRGKDFIQVAWVEETSNKWEVAYWLASEDISKATKQIVTEQSATISGLMASTSYNISIRTICGESYSEWTNPVIGETFCVVPYAEAQWSFEDDAFNKCWFASATGYSSMPSIVENTPTSSYTSRYARTGNKALYLYGQSGAGSSAYAITPLVDADYNQLQLHIYLRMTYLQDYEDPTKNAYDVEGFNHGQERDFFVGVVDNPEDLSNIMPLATYTCPVYEQKPNPLPENDYWDEIIVPLYGMQDKYFVLYTNEKTTQTYIDDVVFEPVTGCPAPAKITADPATLTDHSADVQWQSGSEQWNVLIWKDQDTICNKQVSTASVHIDNLEPNTVYNVKVQALCDHGLTSEFTQGNIKTLCAKADTVNNICFWDFESNLDSYTMSGSTYLQPACWSLGSLGTSASSEIPNIATDNSSYGYSRNVSEGKPGVNALRLRGRDDAIYSSHAILPELAFDAADMLLRFYARIGNMEFTLNMFNPKGAFRYNPESSHWPNDIVVGYTTGDDFSTFVPMDTMYVTTSYTVTAFRINEDERADRFWDNFVIPLKDYVGEGRRICIVYDHSHTMGVSNTGEVFIDDVSIVPNDVCLPPYNVTANNVTSSGATLTWSYTSVKDFRLQVSLNRDFETLLVDTNITEEQYVLDNLTPGTRYYVRMRHNCYAGEFSDWSDVMDFSTGFALRFVETFPVTGETLPQHWNKGRYTKPEEAFNGASINGPVLFAGTDEWNPYLMNDVMTVGHMYCETYNIYSSTQWLFTPQIDLTDQIGKKIMLSFDLAVTSITGLATSTQDVADEFWILVSLDNGVTWSKDNSVLFSNMDNTAAHKYAEIPVSNIGKKFYIDFTKYVGKNIKIAFVSVSTAVATKHYLHLGNVQLNTYTEYNFTSSLCQYEDFENEHVYIDAADIPTGHSVIERFTASNKNGVDDKLVVSTLDVEAVTTTEFTEISCQGETYNKNGFNFIADKSGKFQQKLQSASALGCDSAVILNLTVLPASETDSIVTMCQGAFVEIGNKKYYTSGNYKDTLTSVTTGCDSIINLFLTITPVLNGQSEAWICPGANYQLGDTTLTTAGVYSRMIQNALGCDSMVTLTLHGAENVRTRYIKAICYGETYSDENVSQISAQGDYQFDLKTEHGCDSTVTLHLLVASPEKVINDQVNISDLPYVFDNQELIPADAKEGVQTFMINTTCGIVTLNVTVGAATGLIEINQNGTDEIQKVVYNNHVYIIRNNVWYDIIGTVVK